MAYKNLINVDCADKAELFCRFRDFLCARNGTYDYSTSGIGWTLHDASYATDENNPASGDWFVAYSAGESGNEDIYVYVEWGSEITVNIYLYWDNSAHTGTIKVGYSNYFDCADSGEDYILSVYGDMDEVCAVHTSSSLSYGAVQVVFGKFQNLINGGGEVTATTTDSPASGTDVVITVDAVPSTWVVGLPIVIRDNSNIEVSKIKAISGTDVTFDLSNSYTTPKLSEFCGYFVSGNSGIRGGGYVLVGMSGSTSASIGILEWTISNMPDPNGLYIFWPLHFGNYQQSYVGTARHIYGADDGNLALGDVLEDFQGNQYRYHSKMSNYPVVSEEV